jgi:hypothetical protein
LTVIRNIAPLMIVAFVVAGQARPAEPQAARRTNVAYDDAKPVLEALRNDLPEDLRDKTAADLERMWPAWVSRRDADIRARLVHGDEDSLLNFLLFGTTFTRLPRALNDSAKIGGPARAGAIVGRRIDEMADGIVAPGDNERLRFARQLVERAGVKPSAEDGREQVRLYLRQLMARVVGEMQRYARDVQSARSLNDPAAEFAERSRLFRARGLSSDTSILPDFAVEETLKAMVAKGALSAGNVRRVAIIGPGLDFTDKAEGYDFYPQQTMQPFALIDSLIRSGVAHQGDLQLTTFDLSPRINQHLEAARRRAADGANYKLELVRDAGVAWHASLDGYWRRFGDRIGEAAKGVQPPADAGPVQTRAVRVRPGVVLSIVPQDLNIVLQRIEPALERQPFDLIVATNIFVYYDAFEQSLGLLNVAAMLRPGGFLLSNNALPERVVPTMTPAGATTVIYTDRPDDRDEIVWYRRL